MVSIGVRSMMHRFNVPVGAITKLAERPITIHAKHTEAGRITLVFEPLIKMADPVAWAQSPAVFGSIPCDMINGEKL